MTRVLGYLGRFAIIILGYAVAALAASAFLNLMFIASAGFSREEAPTIAGGALVFSVPFVALFVAYFAFLPSVAAILVAEAFGRRDWLSYAVGGAIVGIAVVALFAGTAEIDPDLGRSSAPFAVIGGGIFGGLAYWLAAGRLAGRWRDGPTGRRSAGPPG